MKSLTYLSALVICCFSAACTKELPVSPESQAPGELFLPAPPASYPGFTVNNNFGLKMYGAIYRANPEKNLCVSPFSIRTALSMVANGAAGEDLKEILRALDVYEPDMSLENEDYQNLARYLLKADPKVTYEAANSFWYQIGIKVHEPFRDNMTDYYDADIYPVNFGDPGTLDLMNGWVSEKTHGKITEIINSIPANTLMNLTNAIYFNGEWTYKFDRKGTKPWSFTKLDRTRVDIAIMSNIQKYRYYEHPSWYGLEMPYGNGDWAMYFFLPHQTGKLDKLTPWLVNNWENIRKGFKEDHDILVRIPQFQIENEIDLVPLLQSMGISKVFEPGANFSKMMEAGLYIGKATHKTYLKVNEDGTEAAAITSFWGVGGGPGGLFFDHPFTYVIAERTTGLILFIGQVMDPTSE